MIKFENLEDIKKYINKGLRAIERHEKDFTKEEKEDYFYAVANIEVLLTDAYKMSIRDSIIKTYDHLIEEFEKADNIGAVTKLEIYYNFKDCDRFAELTNENKEKIINYIYTYWINNTFEDYNLYNICDMLMDSVGYCGVDILQDVDNLTYEDFEKIINEC